jgi:hypothetical protein
VTSAKTLPGNYPIHVCHFCTFTTHNGSGLGEQEGHTVKVSTRIWRGSLQYFPSLYFFPLSFLRPSRFEPPLEMQPSIL